MPVARLVSSILQTLPPRAVWALVLTAFVVTTSAAQRTPRMATPVDAVEGLVRAFRSHRVVVFNEFHDSEAQHAFLRSLIRDARFTAVVNDIVIEFGNALYQDVVDRWVQGEDVPDASVQRAWNYTTVGMGVGEPGDISQLVSQGSCPQRDTSRGPPAANPAW